jgi:hypothetical protein
MRLYKGNPDFVYASVTTDISNYIGYYTSTDGGASWTLRSTSLGMSPQGWYNNAHLVKANDPNTVLVGTIDLNKSVNGGSTFSVKSNWSAWVTEQHRRARRRVLHQILRMQTTMSSLQIPWMQINCIALPMAGFTAQMTLAKRIIHATAVMLLHNFMQGLPIHTPIQSSA